MKERDKEKRSKEREFKTTQITNALFIFVMILMSFMTGINISAGTEEENSENPMIPSPDPCGEKPSVATDTEGNIQVAWRDQRHGNWDIYYANSTNAGESFGWNIKVYGDLDSTNYNPDIAVDSTGNPHIVWRELRGGSYYIRYTRSTNGGYSFRPSLVIAGPSESFGLPAITIDTCDRVHIVYCRSNKFLDLFVLFARSDNGGESFNWYTRIDDGHYQANSVTVDIDVDVSNNPCVIWDAWDMNYPWGWKIMFDKSNDGGNSFQTDIRVDNDYDCASKMRPSIGIYNQEVIDTTWADKREGEWHIWVARSENGGSTFQYHSRIDDPLINIADSPSLALLWDQPHVVWDRSGVIDQDYMRDGPYQWGWDIRVSDWPHESHNPAIATDTSNYYIHVVWDSIGYIVYDKSTDGGDTFGIDVVVTGPDAPWMDEVDPP